MFFLWWLDAISDVKVTIRCRSQGRWSDPYISIQHSFYPRCIPPILSVFGPGSCCWLWLIVCTSFMPGFLRTPDMAVFLWDFNLFLNYLWEYNLLVSPPLAFRERRINNPVKNCLFVAGWFTYDYIVCDFLISADNRKLPAQMKRSNLGGI